MAHSYLKKSMTIDISIVTYKPEGIFRVAKMVLPPLPGVSYVVSWQDHRNTPIPDALKRPDITILRFDGYGLSENRNNVIANCKADIVLIADDDLKLFPDGIRQLISTFESTSVDVATYRSIMPHKIIYPTHECKLSANLPKNYSVRSFEIAIRRATAGHLRCCPELGLTHRMHGGEDEILLYTAIKHGLDCRFFPITISEHDHPSTGDKASFTDCNLRAFGCVIALMNPFTAILRIPLKGWRISRAGKASLPRALFFLSQGALEAPFLLHRNKKYLW